VPQFCTPFSLFPRLPRVSHSTAATQTFWTKSVFFGNHKSAHSGNAFYAKPGLAIDQAARTSTWHPPFQRRIGRPIRRSGPSDVRTSRDAFPWDGTSQLPNPVNYLAKLCAGRKMGRSAASTVCFASTRSLWRVNLANMTDFRSIFARIWLFPGPFSVRWAQ